jgi:hypothetical protein
VLRRGHINDLCNIEKKLLTLLFKKSGLECGVDSATSGWPNSEILWSQKWVIGLYQAGNLFTILEKVPQQNSAPWISLVYFTLLLIDLDINLLILSYNILNLNE